MNQLQRFYEAVTYPLTKWWFTRKYREFLKNKRHFKAVMHYYDAIYRD